MPAPRGNPLARDRGRGPSASRRPDRDGTHGRAGFEHLLLGSVTEKLLRRAPCPVLTVCHAQKPSAKRQLFRRIVCAADLTDDSAHTVAFALSAAEENEARVILLHVLDGRLEAGSLRRDLEA